MAGAEPEGKRKKKKKHANVRQKLEQYSQVRFAPRLPWLRQSHLYRGSGMLSRTTHGSLGSWISPRVLPVLREGKKRTTARSTALDR